MSNHHIDTEQGHWLLAKMGKKVLRPGGRLLTVQLLDDLAIGQDDEVIEFAPGMGYTATLTLKRAPKSYTGVEMNEEAAQRLEKALAGKHRRIIRGSAAEVPLADASVTKVYGEAMLTMQADHRKREIIREAYRLLKEGGLYGIHELSLSPDPMDDETKSEIQQTLARAIKVNARPLTRSEWVALLETEGFRVKKVSERPMLLLEAGRVLEDEGLLRTLKIGFNVLTHGHERERLLAMRKVFRKYRQSLRAIAIVAEKH